MRGSMRKFTRISVERGGYPIFPSGDRAVGTTQPTYGDGIFLRPPRLCGQTILATNPLGTKCEARRACPCRDLKLPPSAEHAETPRLCGATIMADRAHDLRYAPVPRVGNHRRGAEHAETRITRVVLNHRDLSAPSAPPRGETIMDDQSARSRPGSLRFDATLRARREWVITAEAQRTRRRQGMRELTANILCGLRASAVKQS